MDITNATALSLEDLTIDNITDNVITINSQCADVRMKYIFERLVRHLHDFARETRLSTNEWMAGIIFLTEVGRKCTDIRQEFILLSDVLGLSVLVDSIDHPKPTGSTESTVLGPFHTHDALEMNSGAQMFKDLSGKPMLVLGTVKDREGQSVKGVKIGVWQNDSTGHYDVQYADRADPNGRGILYSDTDGNFWFTTTQPVGYSFPDDGPVPELLNKLNRHRRRPAHFHFMFEKDGYEHLTTQLFIRGDPYQNTDVGFAVKQSLIIDIAKVDTRLAAKYGVPEGSGLISHKFVLITEAEGRALRDQNAQAAFDQLGCKVRIVNGLPVPDID